MLGRRHVRDVAACAALIAVGVRPLPALAQAKSVRAQATGSFGYNAVQTDGPVTPGAGETSGPFTALSPSVVFQYDRPRVEQSLEYAFTVYLPFDTRFRLADDLVTYSNRGTYVSHVYVAPTTDLLVVLAVTQAPLNVTAVGSDPSATPVRATPTGASYTLEAAAQEGLTKQLSETLRFTQSTAVTVGLPFDSVLQRSRTYALTNGLSLEKSRKKDTFTGTGAVTYAHFTPSEELDGTRIDARDQWVNTLVGSYRRELSAAFAVVADAGALQSWSPRGSGAGFWSPTGGLSLTYARRFAEAQLAYAHMAQLDLLVGQINLVDQVSLRVAVPLGRSGFTVSGTAAFEHTRPITEGGDTASPINVWLGDAGVSWSPRRVPNLGVGARFSVTRQDPLDPAVPGFTRETVVLNVAFGFPSAAAATQPPHISPVYRAAPVQTSDFSAAARTRREEPTPPEEETVPPGPRR